MALDKPVPETEAVPLDAATLILQVKVPLS